MVCHLVTAIMTITSNTGELSNAVGVFRLNLQTHPPQFSGNKIHRPVLQHRRCCHALQSFNVSLLPGHYCLPSCGFKVHIPMVVWLQFVWNMTSIANLFFSGWCNKSYMAAESYPLQPNEKPNSFGESAYISFLHSCLWQILWRHF